MGDDSSHSIFESILNNLKKIQQNLTQEMSSFTEKDNETDSDRAKKSSNEVTPEQENDSGIKKSNTINLAPVEGESASSDLKISMGLHRKLLDHEVEEINSELEKLLKNKESIDYLITLIQKREKIANQIDKIDHRMGNIDREIEKGVS